MRGSRARRGVRFAAACLLAAACGASDGITSSSDASLGGRTCTPARPAESGVSSDVHVVGDVEQPYWVLVPSGYTGAELRPLYLMLPGGAGDGELAMLGWRPAFEMSASPAILVFPDLRSGRRDVKVLRELIGTVADDFCIDIDRVYAIGGSSSATITAQLVTDAPDAVAAAVIGIGGFINTDNPDTAAPVLAYTGGTDLAATGNSVERWAERNRCTPQPTVTDLGSDVFHRHYEDCAEPLEFYVLENMGHRVPFHQCEEGSPYCAEFAEFDLIEAADEFFAQHSIDCGCVPGTTASRAEGFRQR